MTQVDILLFGKEGQVGHALQNNLKMLGNVVSFGKKEADFEQPEAIIHLLRTYKPRIIINAVAYTDVDKAESEPQKAYHLNAEMVKIIAEEAARLDAWLIHYSTDYVFDGAKVDAYIETDSTHPLNTYGISKLAGEAAIRDAHNKYIILRSSWIYSDRKNNFILSILKQASKQDIIEVVSDSVGSPTSAQFIATATALIVQRIQQNCVTPNDTGIYHLCAKGHTSWYDYAKLIVSHAHQLGLSSRASPTQVLPIAIGAYKNGATRPVNSKLCTDKINKTFHIACPQWQEHVIQCIADISKNNNFI